MSKYATPAHAAVHEWAKSRLAERPLRAESPYRTGQAWSQPYPSGPRAWAVMIHVDGKFGLGKAEAQICISCDRRGYVEVEAEARRDARTGLRMACPPGLLDAAQELAVKVGRGLTKVLQDVDGILVDPALWSPVAKQRQKPTAETCTELDFNLGEE